MAVMKLNTVPRNAQVLRDGGNATTIIERLRDRSLRPGEVRAQIAAITRLLATKAIAMSGEVVDDEQIAIVVILRSGMAMMEPFVAELPPDADMVIYHLGLFREKETLQPVEYYNKLAPKNPRIKRGFVLDPLIATGGTSSAAIQILKDWGLEKITFVSVLASDEGLHAAATAWPEGVEFVVAAVDPDLDKRGFVQPGLGDIGDRLFGTALK